MHGGSGAMRHPQAPRKTHQLMDPSRQRDRRRILRLFRPVPVPAQAVLALIVVSSAISMINPFLIRDGAR